MVGGAINLHVWWGTVRSASRLARRLDVLLWHVGIHTQVASKMKLFLLYAVSALICASSAGAAVPLPTTDILEWTKMEIGAFFSFNMISVLENISNTQYFCLGVGGSGGWLPDPYIFNPEKLDIDQWVAVAKSFGAKYAVLTAQHCSGFSLWPTDVFEEGDLNYTFSTMYASFRGGGYDIVKDFVQSCRKAGIKPGIYYSLNQNYYLNSRYGVVLNTTLVPGQEKVSQEQYGKIVLAQMKQLWSNYGQLAEIWFDGACSVPGINESISSLLEQLQPHAVYFQGCAKQNNMRWVGTETGEPTYPIWSTANDCTPGSGDPNGDTFCPAESDTTLQAGHRWFARKNFPIRDLDDLKKVYLKTVGQNTNLLLNVAANSDGVIFDASVQRYKEFGEWIDSCFSNKSIVAQNSGKGYVLKVQSSQPVTFESVVIQEDQTNGQSVKNFTVQVVQNGGFDEEMADNAPVVIASGSSIGHKAILTGFSSGKLTANGVIVNVTEAEFEPMLSVSLHLCNTTHY